MSAGVAPAAPGAAGAETRGPAVAWIGAGLLLALCVRWMLLDYVTGDVKYWVSYWYLYLRDHRLSAFRHELPNDDGWSELGGSYPPTYYYLLYVATFFDGLAPAVHLIKAVSIAFDFLAAAFVWKIARLHPESPRSRSWLGFFAVLLAPTLVMNSAFWGQCDAIHASLLLGAVYFSLTSRPVPVVVLFTLALSVKAQAVFLAPYLLVLILHGRLRWRHCAYAPLTYVFVMLPAVLLGRPPMEILTIYLRQGRFLAGLSLNAPNLYYFVGNEHYRTGLVLGTLAAIGVCLAYAWRAGRSRRPLSPEFLLLSAAYSLALAPFVLPKMHDRYFLAADLCTIALALFVPRLWFIPVGFQLVSSLAYVPVVSDTLTGFGGEVVRYMPLAVFLNVLLMTSFTVVFLRQTRQPG